MLSYKTHLYASSLQFVCLYMVHRRLPVLSWSSVHLSGFPDYQFVYLIVSNFNTNASQIRHVWTNLLRIVYNICSYFRIDVFWFFLKKNAFHLTFAKFGCLICPRVIINAFLNQSGHFIWFICPCLYKFFFNESCFNQPAQNLSALFVNI